MSDVAAAIQDAWTELRIHRGRVLMSLIGVTVAIAALTASVALGEVARTTMVQSMEANGGRPATVVFWIDPGPNATEAPDPDAALDAIDAVTARYAIEHATARSSGLLLLGGARLQVSVEGVEPDFRVMRHLPIAEGRFLVESDRARLAPAVVVNRGMLDALGGGGVDAHRTIELAGTAAVVVGVVDRGLQDDWPQAWMLPRDLARLSADGSTPSIALEVWVPEELADEATRTISRDLGAALSGAYVSANRNDWRALEGYDPLLPLQLTLVGTAGVILVLGALGLVTVSVVSIRQRVRELGIRRAFGASRSRIFFAVLLESVVGTVVAGAIGIGLCIVAYRLPIVQETLTQGVGGATLPGFPMGAALAGLLVAALVGAIAGSVPATIAVRSKVIEAIRF